jgi:DNA gyrase/topoisomerase IV subunit A
MQAFSVNMNTNDNTDSLLKAIEDLPLVDEMKSSFLSYALSTILGRALPDARDGLKPVHRRVLFSMLGLNLLPDSGYRKCARVVGIIQRNTYA